jgi:hypothetical protein
MIMRRWRKEFLPERGKVKVWGNKVKHGVLSKSVSSLRILYYYTCKSFFSTKFIVQGRLNYLDISSQ